MPLFQKHQTEDIDVDNDVVDDTAVLFNEIDYYTSHLTQQEYEVAELSNQFDNQIGEEGVIQRQTQKKYDLRTREGAPKATTSDQNKKHDVLPKPNPRKDMSSKAQQLPPLKPVVPKIKEVDMPTTSFSLENELRNIKIHVPLT